MPTTLKLKLPKILTAMSQRKTGMVKTLGIKPKQIKGLYAKIARNVKNRQSKGVQPIS